MASAKARNRQRSSLAPTRPGAVLAGVVRKAQKRLVIGLGGERRQQHRFLELLLLAGRFTRERGRITLDESRVVVTGYHVWVGEQARFKGMANYEDVA